MRRNVGVAGKTMLGSKAEVVAKKPDPSICQFFHSLQIFKDESFDSEEASNRHLVQSSLGKRGFFTRRRRFDTSTPPGFLGMDALAVVFLVLRSLVASTLV